MWTQSDTKYVSLLLNPLECSVYFARHRYTRHLGKSTLLCVQVGANWHHFDHGCLRKHSANSTGLFGSYCMWKAAGVMCYS